MIATALPAGRDMLQPRFECQVIAGLSCKPAQWVRSLHRSRWPSYKPRFLHRLKKLNVRNRTYISTAQLPCMPVFKSHCECVCGGVDIAMRAEGKRGPEVLLRLRQLRWDGRSAD